MKKFLTIVLTLGFILIWSPAIGREAWGEYRKDLEKKTSYVFSPHVDIRSVYAQVLNILNHYSFPIERMENPNYVETGWMDIKRSGRLLFKVKYMIWTEKDPTRITVVSNTKGASARHSRNAGWWLIKKVVRMTGR